MGWWTVERRDETLLQGDGPYDAIGSALEEVTRQYETECGRKPTVAELLLTFETVLGAGSHMYALDGEQVEITALVAKTRKRRKFQPYGVGDSFTIQLPGGLRAFGRILSDVRPDLGMLVGIYEKVSSRLLSPHDLQHGPFMFPPFFCTPQAWQTWRWRITGNLPVEPGEFSFPRNKVLSATRGWLIQEGDQEHPATEDEVRELDYASLCADMGVERRIVTHLRETGVLPAE